MPWWGWLIAFCVVWVSVVAAVLYVYLARKASRVVSEMNADFNRHFTDRPRVHPYHRGT